MENLEKYRNLIDKVDKKIIDCIIERYSYVKEIGEIKKSNNLPIYVPEREKALLEKLDQLVASGKKKLKLLIPYSEGNVVADIHRLATVLECDYADNGTLILAECDARAQGTFEKYIRQ
jgi:chorismate mutase